MKEMDLEFKSFYMLYLRNIFNRNSQVFESGYVYLIPNGLEGIEGKGSMTINDNGMITILEFVYGQERGEHKEYCYTNFQEFKASKHYPVIIRHLMSETILFDHTTTGLIEEGQKDYVNLLGNRGALKEIRKDPILDIATEFELTLRSSKGRNLKVRFNTITEELELVTDMTRYQGYVDHLATEDVRHKQRSLTGDEIEDFIVSINRVADGWEINGVLYESVNDYIDQ